MRRSRSVAKSGAGAAHRGAPRRHYVARLGWPGRLPHAANDNRPARAALLHRLVPLVASLTLLGVLIWAAAA
jgi:hypothetical protein